MKVGIPRALFYYHHQYLWERFFQELAIPTIVSPKTNKEIVKRGMHYGIDESCLSSKIFLGHVDWLIGRCDAILIPRIADYGRRGTVCTKFQAAYDVVANTFRNKNIRLLHYNVDPKSKEYELNAYLKLGKSLGKSRLTSLKAYLKAKQYQKEALAKELAEQSKLLREDKIKILVIAHRYNILDPYVGEPILQYLRRLGTIPVIGDIAPKKEVLARAAEISGTLPWALSKELVGAIPFYKDRIDGIILMSAFPCGPDSLVNEMIIRRIKDKPILNLTMDGQEGTAGIETRLESFVDIIKFQKDEWHEQHQDR